MGLRLIKIEHFLGDKYMKANAGARKWLKDQRNRKIRRAKIEEVPPVKEYRNYEF